MDGERLAKVRVAVGKRPGRSRRRTARGTPRPGTDGGNLTRNQGWTKEAGRGRGVPPGMAGQL